MIGRFVFVLIMTLSNSWALSVQRDSSWPWYQKTVDQQIRKMKTRSENIGWLDSNSAVERWLTGWQKAHKKSFETKYRPARKLETATASARIPRRIYQLAYSLDDELAKNGGMMQTWQELNPEYDYFVFNDTDCEDMIRATGSQRALLTWQLLRPGSQRADVCRVLLLQALGGVYADTDVELYKPLRDVLPANASFVTSGSMPFTFLAFSPGHPILQHTSLAQSQRILQTSLSIDFPFSSWSSNLCGKKGCVLHVSGPYVFLASVASVMRAASCSITRVHNNDAAVGWPCLQSGNEAVRAVHVACKAKRQGKRQRADHVCDFAEHHPCGREDDPQSLPCSSSNYREHVNAEDSYFPASSLNLSIEDLGRYFM